MKTIQTNVYKYNELSEDAKEAARNWYREASYGDNYFAESVIEDAATIADLFGFNINQKAAKLMNGATVYKPAVYWSGFCNQGDGACCEGSWDASKVTVGGVAGHVGDSEACKEIKRIAAGLEDVARKFPTASFTVKHSGHYSHEYCTSFDVDPGEPEGGAECLQPYLSPEDDPEDATQLAVDRYREDFPEDAVVELARDFMRWIYDQLEKEYEFTMSDETVTENILANEYEFTADGNLA